MGKDKIKIEVHPLTQDPNKAWSILTNKSCLKRFLQKIGFAKGDRDLQVLDCNLKLVYNNIIDKHDTFLQHIFLFFQIDH